MCAHQFFLEYNLGWRGPSGQKADKGTIVHKALEIAAVCKKAVQDGVEVVEDDVVGSVLTANYEPEYMDYIIERVYNYYTELFDHHAWSPKDYKDCKNWTWKALQLNDGMFDPRNRNVVEPELKFDFEIKEDWAKYNYDMGNGDKLEGYLSLKGTIDLVTDLGDKCYEVIDWKGLPINTKIPTLDGFTTMGNIKEGEIVFDQYGMKCKVVGKSKIKTKECFKIMFDDNTSAVCDNEHLWKLSNGETVSVVNLKKGDKIKVASPIECKDVNLPIQPYLLGAWLGDGRNRSCEISSGDPEIFNNLHLDGNVLGKNLENRSNIQTISKTVYNTTNKLKTLDLLHNKHIPNIYFRSSYHQRLCLLRGLMDTDGNVNIIRKQAVFTSCNAKLANDVHHLLLTLGQRPYKYKQTRKTNFSNGNEIEVYHISFRPININPFRLRRKASKVNPNWGYGKSNIRQITSIEKDAKQKTQCIAVDSPDNTYLCTENYIPTHNTGRRLDWATGEEKTEKKLFEDPQLRLYHYAVHKTFPDIDHIIMTIYYINDGGPFSIHFSNKDIPKTEEMIQKKFEFIKKTTKPSLLYEKNPARSWVCRKLCHHGKTTFEGTDIEPMKDPRNPSQYLTKCEQTKRMIKQYGIEWVSANMSHSDHNLDHYKAPGGK